MGKLEEREKGRRSSKEDKRSGKGGEEREKGIIGKIVEEEGWGREKG